MVLPFVRDLLADLKSSASFDRARTHLLAGRGRRRISGLTFTARALYLPYLIAALPEKTPTLLLVADNKAAETLHQALLAAADLTGALAPASIVRLPAHDVLPFENLSPHPEIQETRAATLWKIASRTTRIVVAPVEAACAKLFASDFYAALALTLKVGEEYLPDMLVEHLLSVGYTRVDVVEMPGQLTLRGGILDVYSPEMDRPARIDFFGDEIESIRKFDPETQRSQSSLDTALLLPLTEIPITERVLEAINARLTRKGTAAAAELEGGETPRELQTHVATRTGESTVFPGWEFFAPVAGASKTLLDLLGPDTRVFVEEPAMIKNQGERWWNKVEQRHDRSGIGNLIRPEDLYLSPWALNDALRLFGADLDQLGAVDILDADRIPPAPKSSSPPAPPCASTAASPPWSTPINSLIKQEARVLLTAPNQGEVERLAGLLGEYKVPYRLGSRNMAAGSETIYSESSYLSGSTATAVIVRTPIANGVQVLDLEKHSARQIVVFGANDLTDEADITARPATRKSKTSAFISDFRDLAVGDYVVHVEHGIAQYCGLRTFDENSDSQLEMMILEFADQAKLYVPSPASTSSRSTAPPKPAPPPSSTSSATRPGRKPKPASKKPWPTWPPSSSSSTPSAKPPRARPSPPTTTSSASSKTPSPSTPPTTRSPPSADIKSDMESTQPMDRLLCGDVGYGKTEVAMRAAFKAVQDSKQVAVLTPTTVLSFQHYESFKRRFANFPVKVEMLSRFRTAKEKTAIIEEAEAGKIDILIGTHAILAQRLKFQDLGLLIVDEEQRFGVKHKERLKQMRASIDVLAMSATPIPRTLHMSLVGLRDMSVIETPPKDRMAIQTIVAKFDEKLIRTAVEMELERGGQVYFVNNRVETIYELAAKIRELVPSARVVVGHGQLPESELERVMLAFMNHEYDVLVATSIIENGLDIPLANTIIVNRADRHGLSELYQLRGRVGRSNRRAYAYLLIPPDTELTEIARRRLAALKEFSDLGAGFKIAALDLELRGAGNMLGGEQSGHIEAIGFEMYTTMLEEAVTKMKGEGDKPAHATTVLNLGISVRIDSGLHPRRKPAPPHVQTHRRRSRPDHHRRRPQRTPRPLRHPARIRPQPTLAAGELRLKCEQLGIAQLDRKRTQIELPNPTPTKSSPSKQFAEMLHIKFAVPEDTAGTPHPGLGANTLARAGIDPGKLMQIVARNSKRGAQFTPQGIFRYPLTSPKAEDVLAETRTLLDSLEPTP